MKRTMNPGMKKERQALEGMDGGEAEAIEASQDVAFVGARRWGSEHDCGWKLYSQSND